MTITRLPNRDIQYTGSGENREANAYANLVYTDKGTFKNNDSVFPWKQNSSDVYGQLREGKKYRCEVAGWRQGFLNMYPTIIRCN